MTEKLIEQLEARINDLECQVAFQEQTIEDLNSALSQQQLQITKMQDQMKYVVGKVKKYGFFEYGRSSQRATAAALLINTRKTKQSPDLCWALL